jgi:nicotinamide mononucleotide transporter
MHDIIRLLNIEETMFTVFDYPMSYIEFFGTVFTIVCVWLTARAKVISWPIGIIGTVLYIFLFYQIRLYSDLIEQVYFLLSGFWGWWVWLHPKKNQANSRQELKISTSTSRENYTNFGIIAIGTAALTYLTTHLHVWLPDYFTAPTTYPLLDAFTTVLSFVAQWLLVRKKIESWVLWLVVDAIAVWLYWVKGVKFISIEYVLFFFIASYGLLSWIKEYRRHDQASQS